MRYGHQDIESREILSKLEEYVIVNRCFVKGGVIKI